MPSPEFAVVSALQRRRVAARTRPVTSTPVALAVPQASPVRLTRDDCAVRNIGTHDRTNLLARIAACDPAPLIAGETDFDESAPHATPELIRGLSVVPHVPDPTVTESTWERTFRIQGLTGTRNGRTYARDLGDRFALRGIASCEDWDGWHPPLVRSARMTFEGRTAETSTVLTYGRTVPVSRFDPKESVHLRALHENARMDNAARNYSTSRELTMREMIRARALEIAGNTSDCD